MLTIQRASAGSGKTYTLAKTFIKLFISIKGENGERRLRTSAELRDAHSHILAITFTNKATNEMKQRIVEKLADLGSNLPNNKISYLDDFVKELHTSADDIKRTCREALSILLHNYSDFQVSTIDSFFQTILRTFAFETDLNDNYQVELDNDYISKVGVDATLSQVKGRRQENRAVRFWVKQMIDEILGKGGKWNIFNRNQDSGNISLYSKLFSFAKKMQNEDFKLIQDEMTGYFASCGDFTEKYSSIKSTAYAHLCNLHSECKQKADNLITIFINEGMDFHTDAAANLVKLVDSITKSKATDVTDNKPFDTSKKQVIFSSAANKSKKLNTLYPHWKTLADELNESYEQWRGASLLCDIYFRQIYYIGLIEAILRNINQFRDDNDLIQLSDTNQILQKIISDDDTPFVYEKIGYYINHYLIDEFQDTSSLQWKNLHPLVAESIGNGHDNLIIGDAKQSIYRFRNANPDLITTEVPHLFKGSRTIGEDRANNTNWRSSNEIVQFNNTIFSILPHTLDSLDESPRKMESLYSGAIQEIKHRERKGYVEINFIPDGKAADDENVPDSESATLQKMGPLISSLIERGYRQNEIALLVEENKQGQRLIDALLAYNNSLPADTTPIEFVSEESLRISESRAVKAIMSVLEIIAGGIHDSGKDTVNGNHRQRRNTASFYCEYNFHLASDTGADPESAMQKAIAKSDERNETIHNMLSEMQTVALPALVENIIARFVPEPLRQSHAPYIAAFQDKVLEYCENRTSDIASFVKWWNDNASKFSISSPEDIDAVQIMTVHKSKGLEFRCVILPYFRNSFTPGRRTETVWEKPTFTHNKELNEILPPYLPIDLKKELLQTPHRDTYLDYISKYKMDRLNVAYVAFTRAVDELYVFTPLPIRQGKPSKDSSTGYTLKNMLKDIGPELQHLTANSIPYELIMSFDKCNFNDDENRFTYGDKPDTVPAGKSNGHENTSDINDYRVNTNLELLKYKIEDRPNISDCDDEEKEILRNPRSDGSLMHEILSEVKIISDLPKAIRKMVLAGKLTKREAIQKEKELHTALSTEKIADWFAPGLKILNERSLLKRNNKIRRPDRIIINPDGHVTVIDYKFGNKALEQMPDDKRNPTMSKYIRQVSEYMRLLDESGLFKGKAEGYLWFINAKRVVEIKK